MSTFAPPSRQPVWLVLTVLIIAEFNSAFEASMIYSTLSVLHKIYGDPIKVGWLITGFLLVSAAAAALCSRLGDRYGRRKVLIWMLVFAVAGSVVSAAASSLEWVIAGRAIQGVSAAILPLCFGLARERLPVQRISLGIGIISGTALLGAAMGYMAGGVIVENFDWQALFLVSSIMAVMGLLAVLFLLTPIAQPKATGSMDLLGGILFVPAITGIVFAISRAKSWGWLDERTLSLVAGSLVILAIWVRHELRQPHPLIDVRLMFNRQIALANICFALAAFGTFQSQMILFPLMQQPEWTMVGLGISASLAGITKGGVSMFGMAGSSLAGAMAGRSGGRQVLMFGAAVLSVTWVGLTVFHHSLWLVIIGIVGGTIGMAFLYSAVPNLIVEAAPPERASEATGMSSVIRAVFGALGAQAIAYALSSSTISDPAQGPGTYPTDAAFTAALSLVAAASILCWIVAYLLPRRSVENTDSMAAGTPPSQSKVRPCRP